MTLDVTLYKPGEVDVIAFASFDRASTMAAAMMREAPFDKGFDMRVSFAIKGVEYGRDTKFPALADRVLPGGWSLSEECVVIAKTMFGHALETLRELRLEAAL